MNASQTPLACIAYLLVSVSYCYGQFDTEQSIAKTEFGNSTGTCFAFHREGTTTFLATAKHCTEQTISSDRILNGFFIRSQTISEVNAGFVTIYIDGAPTERQPATVVWRSSDSDLAIISVDSESFEPPVLRLADKKPDLHSRHFFAGFSYGDGLAFGVGRETGNSDSTATGSTRPTGGQSGGPVINSGYVVGVVKAWAKKNDGTGPFLVYSTIKPIRDWITNRCTHQE